MLPIPSLKYDGQAAPLQVEGRAAPPLPPDTSERPGDRVELTAVPSPLPAEGRDGAAPPVILHPPGDSPQGEAAALSIPVATGQGIVNARGTITVMEDMAPRQGSLQRPGTPAEIVRTLSAQILQEPCITQGLDQAYSPNHPGGMTTRVHLEKQAQMVNFYVGSEIAAVEHLGSGNYDGLHGMIANTAAPEALRVAREDIEKILEPLRQGLTMRGGQTGIEIGWA